MCQIVNFNQHQSVEKLNREFGDRWTYIGRENGFAGLGRSPLANPFKVAEFGGRGQTLPHYKRWLWQQIQNGNEEVLEALRQINKDTVLVCWCKPGPCHGDVVIKAAEWLRNNGGQ